MKKNIFISFLSIILLFAISCKKDIKLDKLDTVEVVKDTTEVVIEEKKPEVQKPKKKKKTTSKKKGNSNKSMRIPGTSWYTDNADSKKYIKDYERYVYNYKKAVNAHDMDSFIKLGKASSSLSKQYLSLMSKLPGDEIEKLSEYMKVKSNQIDELSKKMQ